MYIVCYICLLIVIVIVLFVGCYLCVDCCFNAHDASDARADELLAGHRPHDDGQNGLGAAVAAAQPGADRGADLGMECCGPDTGVSVCCYER